MRDAAIFFLHIFDSRNLLTAFLLFALALMTCFNLVQARVIQIQREEVRRSVANDFVYLHLLLHERKAAAVAQNKKAEPAAPPQSK